jgi:hypothetical protein
MSLKLSLAAVAIALIALVVAAMPQATEVAAPSVSDARVEALERQLARLSTTVEELNLRLRTEGAGALGAPGVVASAGSVDPAGSMAEEQMKAMVDAAVSKKAKEVVSDLEIKQNKKPAIDVLASVLGLDDAQRRLTEAEVIRGQREAYAILDIPTADGGNLMDELVEVAAGSVAFPGTDPGWGAWFVKVITEKIPGSDETYAARIEAVKATVRESFRESWSAEQFAKYREWGVDPIEIQKVPGSPGEELERRFMERARVLGELYPDGPPK